jgi:hypothetical protein
MKKMISLDVFRKAGAKGGKRSMETMSDCARKTRAKKAAEARWAKAKKAAPDA